MKKIIIMLIPLIIFGTSFRDIKGGLYTWSYDTLAVVDSSNSEVLRLNTEYLQGYATFSIKVDSISGRDTLEIFLQWGNDYNYFAYGDTIHLVINNTALEYGGVYNEDITDLFYPYAYFMIKFRYSGNAGDSIRYKYWMNFPKYLFRSQ